MQIHELTKRRQIKEGLWDELKAAIEVGSGRHGDLDDLSFKDARKAAQRSGQIEKASRQAQQVWQQYVVQLEKAIAQRAPAQAAQPAATAPAEEPIFVGGQRLDPKNPKDAKMIQQFRQQQVKEAVQNPLQSFRNRTDGLYEKYLKAFVQKNLFSGMPYSRLINAQTVDQIIKDMSRPENASPEKQAPFWQQLGLEAATAQILPQASGGMGSYAGDTDKPQRAPQQTQTSDELVEPVKQAEKEEANLSEKQLADAGAALRKRFTGNETDIDSTGDEAVDALLKAMGFDVR